MGTRFDENVEFRGTTIVRDLKANDGCIENKHIEVGAGLEATKLEHQHPPLYSQESGTTVAADTHAVHLVHGLTGTIRAFKVGCVVACVGDATVTVDLHNGGVSILTAPVVIDSGDAARAVLAGTIDDDTLVADDLLEVVVTVNAGGTAGVLGKGVFADVVIHEDAT